VELHLSFRSLRKHLEAKGKPIPLQFWTVPESCRSFSLPDFSTIGTWSWSFCQP